MFKISFEKPKISIGVSEETRNLFDKAGKPKKKEKPKPWTHKERVLVGLFLAFTVFLSLYLWYGSQNKLPEFNLNFGGFGLNEKVILEK